MVDDFLYAFFGFGVVVVVEFEAECAEFEIPEAALNAGDMSEADLSGLLSGLGLDEVVEEATEDVTEEVAE